VTAARGAFVHAVLSYHVRHSILLPFMGMVLPTFRGAKIPRVWLMGHGYAPCWVTRRGHSGSTGGKILFVSPYREEMEERIVPGSNYI
jgi:hypothetical protein